MMEAEIGGLWAGARKSPQSHTCGCYHAVCVPLLPYNLSVVFYPTFLFHSNSAPSYSFRKQERLGLRSGVEVPALGAIPYTTKILNIFFSSSVKGLKKKSPQPLEAGRDKKQIPPWGLQKEPAFWTLRHFKG